MEYEEEFGYKENFESTDDDIYDTYSNFFQQYNDIYHNDIKNPSLEDKIQELENRLAENPSTDERERLELLKQQYYREGDEYGKEKLKKVNDLNGAVEKYVSLKNEELDKIIPILKQIDLSSKSDEELVDGIHFWRNDLEKNLRDKFKIKNDFSSGPMKDNFLKIFDKKILIAQTYLKKFREQKSFLEEKELETFNATPKIDADIDSIRGEVPKPVLEDLEDLKKNKSDLPEKKEEVKNNLDKLIDDNVLQEKVNAIVDEEAELQKAREENWEGYDIKNFIDRLEEKNLKSLFKNQLDNSLNPSVDDREAHIEFLLEGFDNQLLLDQVYDSMWEDRIRYEEQNKFRWSQATTLINLALTDADAQMYIDPDNSYLYDALKERMDFFYDAETHKISEITLDNETLISMDSNNQPVISPENVKLIENIILKISDKNVKSKIIQELGSSVNAKYVAESVILDLREEQKELIKNSKTPKELEKNIKELNEKSKKISDLKKNIKVDILQHLKKGILGSARKLFKFLNEHRGKIKGLGVVTAAAGILSLILKIILPLENNLRKAKAAIENHVRELGKNLNKKLGPLYVTQEIAQSLYHTYSKIQGIFSIFLSFLSYFLSILSLFYLKMSVKTYVAWTNFIREKISFGKTLLLGLVNFIFLLSGVFSLLLLTFILIKWRKKKFP